MNHETTDRQQDASSSPPLESHPGDGVKRSAPAVDRKQPYQPEYTPLWNNLITIGGLFLVVMAIVLMLTFWLFAFVTPTPNPYIDIVGYLVVPCMLVFGVLVIPTGIFFKSWRLHRRDPHERLAFRFPRIDLNDPAQRKVVKVVLAAVLILLPVMAVSGYHGYHYTDSAEFCSKACHTPMYPQATTYEHSAHARVACAECHIGSGASWFVKSKLSGTRQVLAMWRDTFSRPIPPAIKHLRPARETCEHCHWPKKFFGAQLKEIVRFKSDEGNTRFEIDMLLNTGGGDEMTGRAEGIHMHMALTGRVEYIATDDKLQEIPWVRYVDKSGNTWTYRSDGRPSSDPPPAGRVRQLDCMDCHNRPAHKFRSPQDGVDIFLDVGKIDNTLPYIKREAVAALTHPYPDADTAYRKIADHLSTFYETRYPEIWARRKASVNYAIDKVRELYRRSFFPSMKVDWRTYPDNIGHLIAPGCFRCHEGKHVNQRGAPIRHECNTCHTFLNPVERNGDGALIERGAFLHPFELVGPHAELRCDQCHTGGFSPVPTCAGCHTAQAGFRAGTLADFDGLEIQPDPMADSVDCEGCHDLTQETSIETIDTLCVECHEDDGDRFEGMLAGWKNDVDQLLLDARGRSDEVDSGLLESLVTAGPLHNIEATRTILRKLAERPNPAEKPEPTPAP